MRHAMLVMLMVSVTTAAEPASHVARQDSDGVIHFEAGEPTRQLTWDYKATRWGMYWVEAGYASRSQAQLQVRVGEEEFTTTVTPLDEAVAQPFTRLGKLYLPEAGRVRVMARITRPGAVRGVRLVPAPEGGVVHQASDGTLTLHARDATVHGTMLRYEPKPEKDTLGYWVNVDDYATWTFGVTRPGRFEVEVLQGCGQGQGGSSVSVQVGGERLTFDVQDTGHFQTFVRRRIGRVTIDAAGHHRLHLRAVSKAKRAVADVREIRLIPIAAPHSVSR